MKSKEGNHIPMASAPIREAIRSNSHNTCICADCINILDECRRIEKTKESRDGYVFVVSCAGIELLLEE